MPAERPDKYAALEADADVKRWLANLARGSPITAEVAKRRLGKACEPFLSTTSTLDEGTLVKEAQIEALKSMAKNLLGIDLLDAKVAKERTLGKDLTTAEELEAYESEIRKLKIDPQKLRKEEAGEYQNKLVRETELEKYLNKGWEMVQTVNSRILIRKPILASKRSE